MLIKKRNIVFLSLSLISSFSVFDKVYAATAPYNIPAYRSVLDQSKLQAPTSTDLILQGDFYEKYNQYFYIDKKTRWMTFSVSGDHKRSELRQMKAWSTSDRKYTHQLRGEVSVYQPEKSRVKEVTFMQIHDVTNMPNAINKPLLRLVWLKDRKGIKNHYWAVLKEDDCQKCKNYLKVDLGPHSPEPTSFNIKVNNSQLTLSVNGQVVPKLDHYNIHYWDDLLSYFKAGVYNQSAGHSIVEFKTLGFYESKK